MSWRATAAVKPITHDGFGRRLTSAEKLVLLIISDYYSDEHLCAWAGTARMATESLLSIRQLLRVIKSLEERELISIEHRKNHSNVYRLKFIPALEKCWYCGADLHTENRESDHQIPKSRGGKGGKNLVLACSTCNGSKSNQTVEEYRLSFFDEGHKFYGEVSDNLSQTQKVNVTSVVTSKTENTSSMSPEPLVEPLGTDIQPRYARPVIDMAKQAIRESQRTGENADAILNRLRSENLIRADVPGEALGSNL